MKKKREIFKFKNSNGVKYKIYIGHAFYTHRGKKNEVYGVCDSPKEKNPEIVLNFPLNKSREELETIIEEITHAFFFEKLEKEVRPMAKTISDFLIEQGWRKINQP